MGQAGPGQGVDHWDFCELGVLETQFPHIFSHGGGGGTNSTPFADLETRTVGQLLTELVSSLPLLEDCLEMGTSLYFGIKQKCPVQRKHLHIAVYIRPLSSASFYNMY